MAIFDNLFGAPPEYLTGLLAPDQTDKLRKQAMTTGLINSAIALIAQPRNQRYGSALPYIGRALMAGQQAGQNVYSNALQGLETQAKLADLKRKQEQQQKMQEMLGGITDPNERLFAQLAPEQYVAGKLKPMQPQAKLLTLEEQKAAGLPEAGRYQQKADGTYELVSGTAPKETSLPSAVQEYQFAQKDPAFAKFLQERKPVGNVVNVNTKGEGKYQETLGSKLAERDVGIIEAGQSAPKQYESSQRVKQLLAQNPITGVGAEQITQLNNLLSSSGLINPKRGVTTEVLASNLADTTLQNIKTSGLGAGQGFTDKDRQFLERAKAGQISMTAESLRYLAELNEKSALSSIENYNKLVNRIPQENRSYYGLNPISIPSAAPKGRLR